MQPIFTLDARDNSMLEVIRDYFKLSGPQVRHHIQGMHLATQNALIAKSINYNELRSGLVPSTDRHEAGFVFESRSIESGFYGAEVARVILPHLDKQTTQSVLHGDLICKNQDLIFRILEDSLILTRSFEFVLSTMLYCVYINNISDTALQRLHSELATFPAYVGFIPATFASKAKTYLSATLIPCFLKHRNKVIMGHEDDRPSGENVNMVGFPFEELGYQVRSLQSNYFDVFLSYKIERAVYDGFQIDTEMALNAISDDALPLNEFTVIIDESKFAYLFSEKAGIFHKAGIAHVNRHDLASMIKAKIAASYIYNLIYLEKHDVIKFNLMLEIARGDGGYPTRLVASLEYKPQDKTLRLITLY